MASLLPRKHPMHLNSDIILITGNIGDKTNMVEKLKETVGRTGFEINVKKD